MTILYSASEEGERWPTRRDIRLAGCDAGYDIRRAEACPWRHYTIDEKFKFKYNSVKCLVSKRSVSFRGAT